MIKTKEDLKLYLTEDAKRNGMNCSWFNIGLDYSVDMRMQM